MTMVNKSITHPDRSVEFIHKNRAIWQSETALMYQCPHCHQSIFSQHEGNAILWNITCDGDGHFLEWSKRPDRYVDDNLGAIHFCQIILDDGDAGTEDLSAVGKMWLQHAIAHLNRKIDASFRDRPRIDTEQHAMALIKGVAEDLKAAGTALYQAAEAMKAKGGLGYQASQAHLAGTQALKAAQELIGA